MTCDFIGGDEGVSIERVKEILAEKNIFHCQFMNGISSFGSISEDCKFILITDRELFNKRSKEVTSEKKKYELVILDWEHLSRFSSWNECKYIFL